MDRFEALMGIGDEVGLLGKQVFSSVVELLDRLEQEGLFIQSRDLLNSLAQTNILADMNQMVIAYQSTAGQDLKAPSLGPLLWEFNQPETKKGLFCILKVLQALGE
ncbi:MAG: hypothetical protein E4H33_00355 [Anaerolineales bacterium]|nr:MAG: hypothetical protein E4H33_00355 [Anaerolineales bacterium]